MFALELAAVSKYFAQRAALSRVSLHLEPGTALGLLGPNADGRTRIRAGDDPQAGSLFLSRNRPAP